MFITYASITYLITPLHYIGQVLGGGLILRMLESGAEASSTPLPVLLVEKPELPGGRSSEPKNLEAVDLRNPRTLE